MEQLLKKWLKKIRLNEPIISTILGGLVIVVVGLLIFNYFKTGQVEEISFEEPGQEVQFIETETGELMPQNMPPTHTVEVNENLWKISQKYYTSGYNWVDIAKENNLLNPNHIEIGQKLKLPLVAVKKPDQKMESANQALPIIEVAETISEDSYEVQKGDYLWQIALRAYGDGYKWTEIAKANNLPNPDYIEIGQVLNLPR